MARLQPQRMFSACCLLAARAQSQARYNECTGCSLVAARANTTTRNIHMRIVDRKSEIGEKVLRKSSNQPFGGERRRRIDGSEGTLLHFRTKDAIFYVYTYRMCDTTKAALARTSGPSAALHRRVITALLAAHPLPQVFFGPPAAIACWRKHGPSTLHEERKVALAERLCPQPKW